jgi:hypothetical protein
MTAEITPAVALARPGLEFAVNQSSSRRKLHLGARTSSLVPYCILSFFWLGAAFAASFAAWVAILITGQYPAALFAFNARAWRALVQFYAYAALVVDDRPPMSGSADPSYPVQANVIRLPEYNRLLTGLRGFIIIPLALVSGFTNLLGYVVLVPSILAVGLTRHQPGAFQRILTLAVRNYALFISSAFLLTEIIWVSGQS